MVIVCIGTPNIVGDSVAPIAGDILINLGVKAFVYGTTARPVTGVNYDSYFKHISAEHSGDTIIAIDSALGVNGDTGVVKVVRGGVSPGGALAKNHAKIGTFGILAQVGTLTDTAINDLMAVPFSLAMALAKRCAIIANRMAQELA